MTEYLLYEYICVPAATAISTSAFLLSKKTFGAAWSATATELQRESGKSNFHYIFIAWHESVMLILLNLITPARHEKIYDYPFIIAHQKDYIIFHINISRAHRRSRLSIMYNLHLDKPNSPELYAPCIPVFWYVLCSAMMEIWWTNKLAGFRWIASGFFVHIQSQSRWINGPGKLKFPIIFMRSLK